MVGVEFALHLRDRLAPEEARADIDGYQVRKTLAKYIDEYNALGARHGAALGETSRT